MKIEITEKHSKMEGTIPELLTGLSMLVKQLKEDVPEGMIRKAINLGFKSDEELEKQAIEILSKRREKMFDVLEKLGITLEED